MFCKNLKYLTCFSIYIYIFIIFVFFYVISFHFFYILQKFKKDFLYTYFLFYTLKNSKEVL